MKKYFKLFGWIYALLAILIVASIVKYSKTDRDTEKMEYIRTNTECLTQERVFDYADELSDAQEQMLSTDIAVAEDEIGCDIIFMLIDEPVDSMMNYADDFYDNNRFGYNEPWGDGALFVANYYTGEAWFCTSGKVEYRYSVNMIDHMTEVVCEELRTNPYESGCTFVKQLTKDMQNKYAGTVEAGTVRMFGILGAAIITVVFLLVNLINSKGKKTTVSNTYVNGGKPSLKLSNDIFLHKHTTHRKIESSSGSGGGGGHHTSSGGHSHGGGGRSF